MQRHEGDTQADLLIDEEAARCDLHISQRASCGLVRDIGSHLCYELPELVKDADLESSEAVDVRRVLDLGQHDGGHSTSTVARRAYLGLYLPAASIDDECNVVRACSEEAAHRGHGVEVVIENVELLLVTAQRKLDHGVGTCLNLDVWLELEGVLRVRLDQGVVGYDLGRADGSGLRRCKGRLAFFDGVGQTVTRADDSQSSLEVASAQGERVVKRVDLNVEVSTWLRSLRAKCSRND